jgi:hypothetical protein
MGTLKLTGQEMNRVFSSRHGRFYISHAITVIRKTA